MTGLVSYPHMLSHAYYFVLPPLFPLLKDAFGVGYTELGLVITVFGVIAGVGQTPVGFLVDRIGARALLIAGLALQSGSVLLIGFATEYWHLLVLYALAGLAHTVYHPADYAILTSRIAKERMGRALGVHSFGGNLAWAITPVFMVGVAALWDWRMAFIAMGALGLAFVPVLLWQMGRLESHRDSPQPAAADKTDSPSTPAEKTSSTRQGLALLLSAPIMLCFAFYVLQAIGFGGMRNFFVAAMDAAHGMPLTIANSGVSGLMAGSAIGILAGGLMADRIGARLATAAVTLITSGTLIVVVGTVSLPVFLMVTLMTVAGFFQGVLAPTRDLIVRTVTPPGSAGKVFAFVSSGQNLANGLVPLLFGWIIDLGHPDWVFWTAGFFIAAALVTFVNVRSRTRSAAQPASA